MKFSKEELADIQTALYELMKQDQNQQNAGRLMLMVRVEAIYLKIFNCLKGKK